LAKKTRLDAELKRRQAQRALGTNPEEPEPSPSPADEKTKTDRISIMKKISAQLAMAEEWKSKKFKFNEILNAEKLESLENYGKDQ
jgi:hypothetical protein